MTPQEILNQKLEIEIGRLVMQIAVLKTNLEVQKPTPERTGDAPV